MQQKKPNPSKDLFEYRILLIEDNLSYMALIKQMLVEITSFHFQLHTTTTLKNGCEEILHHEFDLVLLDLGLPDSEGKHTFDCVMKIANTVPVVLVSGLEDVALATALIKEGAYDYILKRDLNCSLLEKTIKYSMERRNREQSNDETERKYRLIVEIANEGIIFMNRDTVITFCNAQIASSLGYTVDEMIGQKIEKFIALEDMNDHLTQMKIRRNGVNTKYERCLIKKDGEPFCALVSTTAILDSNGQLKESFAMLTDINARKKIETQLKDSISKYQSLVENSPDAIAIYIEGKVVFVNNECLCLMAAKEESELIGKQVLSFVHPNSLALVLERMRKLVQTGGSMDVVEEKFIRLDGSVVDVEVKSMLIHFEGKQAVQLIVRDNSFRKKIADELLESETRYRSLSECSPEPIIVNSNGKIAYANLAALQMFGARTEQELLGQSSLERVHPESLNAVTKRMKEILADGAEKEMGECKLIKLDGSIIIAEAQGVKITFSNERAILITIRDIGKRKKLEETLSDQLRKLQQFQKLTVGRELTMIELKKEVNELLEKANQKKKYTIVA